MSRREFTTLLGSAAVAWPLTARAQQPDRMRLIGVLMGVAESDPAWRSLYAAFRGSLAEAGWTEGGNLRIEIRWGAGGPDRIRSLARELVDLRPDAILGQTTPVIDALARETRTIPIVFVNVSDPVGSGFVANFTQPGGNITGFMALESAMGGKWVELLKEIAPRTVHVRLLFNPETAVPLKVYLPSIQAAASSLAVEVSAAPVHAKDEIQDVIAAQARNPGGGLVVMPDAFTAVNRDLIISLTARYGVPAIYYYLFFAEAGGLIAYGTVSAEQFRQAAGYIDRILKGAKPTNLPVRPGSSWQSTSRRPRRSVSPCLRRCL
jgi:putative ABC transport system substrate-binding protein